MTQQLLEAYESLLQSLWDRIAFMLGRITTHTLMERALFETGKRYPLVNELILRDEGLDFTGLESKIDQINVQQMRDTMNSLVVDVVGVLAEQVGERLAEKVAKKAVLPGEGESE